MNITIIGTAAVFTLIRKYVIEEIFAYYDAALISFVSQTVLTEWLVVFTLGLVNNDMSLAFNKKWLYLIEFMIVMACIIKYLDDNDK